MRRFIDVAGGVAYRGLKKIATNPQLLLPSLIFPLFFFVAFAGGLSSVGDVPGFDFPSGYTAFQFVFVLLQASAFGGVFTGFGIASDFENGFAQRMMLAAPNRLGILAGYALAAMVRAVVVGVLLFVVAVLTGMQIGGDGVDVFGLILLALLVNLTTAMWAAGVAMRLRTIQAGPVMQMPVFIILFLAPVYVPLSLLSGWIHGVAQVQPVHRADRGRARPDLGPVVRRAAGLRRRARDARGLRGLGRDRAAPGGGRRLGEVSGAAPAGAAPVRRLRRRRLPFERDLGQRPVQPGRQRPRAVAQQRHHGGRDDHPDDQDVDQDRARQAEADRLDDDIRVADEAEEHRGHDRPGGQDDPADAGQGAGHGLSSGEAPLRYSSRMRDCRKTL